VTQTALQTQRWRESRVTVKQTTIRERQCLRWAQIKCRGGLIQALASDSLLSEYDQDRRDEILSLFRYPLDISAASSDFSCPLLPFQSLSVQEPLVTAQLDFYMRNLEVFPFLLWCHFLALLEELVPSLTRHSKAQMRSTAYLGCSGPTSASAAFLGAEAMGCFRVRPVSWYV